MALAGHGRCLYMAASLSLSAPDFAPTLHRHRPSQQAALGRDIGLADRIGPRTIGALVRLLPEAASKPLNLRPNGICGAPISARLERARSGELAKVARRAHVKILRARQPAARRARVSRGCARPGICVTGFESALEEASGAERRCQLAGRLHSRLGATACSGRIGRRSRVAAAATGGKETRRAARLNRQHLARAGRRRANVRGP